MSNDVPTVCGQSSDRVPSSRCTHPIGHCGDHSWKRDELNVAIKTRFVEALNSHARLCPVCLVFGFMRCEIGAILHRCAEHGLDVAPIQKATTL